MEPSKMKELIIASREYREAMLADPYRPGYHFAIPEDNGRPGDPNGAFFARGRYHLMYLYDNSKTGAYHWGHISSSDLLHWRQHPDALAASGSHRGYFSGGAFLDDDETAYLSYWKLPDREHPEQEPGGIYLASSRPPYDVWQELENPVLRSTPAEDPASFNGTADLSGNGKLLHVGCADPSNLWKANGFYYVQAGNKPVLDRYGRKGSGTAEYGGDWTDLFRSRDLKSWSYVGRFYRNPHEDPLWPDETEDDMCPSFLPLYDAPSGGTETGKWLQLFISHNKGCQYYVGRLEGETFVPEQHGRMTWKDAAYFAPEALTDPQNRQIMWVWLRDTPEYDFQLYGWSGVYSFPRVVLWKDGALRMTPAQELERLQINPQTFTDFSEETLPVQNGASFRIKGSWTLQPGQRAGLKVRVSPDQKEYTEIYADPQAGVLVMDTTNSGSAGWRVKEEAPFRLTDGEKLTLDIFVDRSVIEVYANEKQAICRRVYPSDPANAVGVALLGTKPERLEAWEIAPTNFY